MSAVLNIDPSWALRPRPRLAELPKSDATRGKSTVSGFASINPFIALLERLDAFLVIENYNGFTLRIDPETHARARRYFEDAYEAVIYPVPELTPDGEGGIDIEWETRGRHLALNVRSREATQPDFISWREPEGRYEGDVVTQELLNDRLRWLSR
jgi:hypothetical protein